MGQKITRWYVQPKGDRTNEVIAEALAFFGCSADSETKVIVEGVEIRVYQVRYNFITQLRNSDAHRDKFYVYVKEGGGMVRRFNLQNKRSKSLRRGPKCRMVAEILASLIRR